MAAALPALASMAMAKAAPMFPSNFTAVLALGFNAINSRAAAKKPKAPSFSNDAAGRTDNIRSSVESHKIIYGRSRVGGALVYVTTTDTGTGGDGNPASGDNLFLHLVFALAGHEVEEIGQIYLNDQAVTLDGDGWVTDEPYNKSGYKHARIYKHLGANDQVAAPEMVADIADWTADHRLRGVAYVYARLQWSADVSPNGIPNISAIVKGKKVYDPRSTLTAWSENAALCVRDYLTSDYGFGCEATEIHDTYFTAAANLCEESVTKADATTQDRYTCNGLVDTAIAPLDNLGQLLTSCAGVVTYVQGQFRLHAAAYDSPVLALTADHLAGDYSIDQIHAPRKELFNAVRGTYVDPAQNWQITDFPPFTNPTYETEDGGEQIIRDFEMPFTTDSEAAQRIAKVILEKGRQGIMVSLPLKHHAVNLSVMDVVTLTLADEGWNTKPFRVMSWAMNDTDAITITLQEESSASYDWNAGEATMIDAAPNTNLPDPFDIAAPGIPTVTESLYSTRSGAGIKAKATVTFAASTNPFVNRYQVEYRLTTTTDWTVLPLIATTTVEVPDIAAGTYLFRVKGISGLGVSSDYATADPKEIFGLSARPADITGLTIQGISSLAHIQWTLHPDLDVTEGGHILIRHSEALIGATWEASVTLGESVSGNLPFAFVPLKTGTYLLKAEDSSGLQSVNAATVVIDDATLLAFSTLATVTEDTSFLGTHSSTYVDGGVLKLAGGTLIDAIPDIDSLTSFDFAGGVASSGTYTFASGIDLTTAKRVRLETSIEVSTVNENDLIDSRTGMVDDWLDFDGTAGGGSVDAWIEVRSTNDDPLGSPTWSAWNRMAIADYNARAFQFRCQLRSYDPAYNIHISKLRVYAKEVT